jgi:serine/threonine protein kinase
MSAAIGSLLSKRYRLDAEIGRGGMGVVYEADDTALERTVALKFLPAELTGHPEARERFLHEARAVSRLDHPNTCTVHEIGETETGTMFIVMTRYNGMSLKERLASGSLKPGEVVRIAA